MSRIGPSLLLAAVAARSASRACAQDSRRDDVIKRGTQHVCTPSDYKPFSPAKATGDYDRTVDVWLK